MEAMSNEGPHIRDYEQKSEMLWNEAPQSLKHNIYSTISLKDYKPHMQEKKNRNFRAQASATY